MIYQQKCTRARVIHAKMAPDSPSTLRRLKTQSAVLHLPWSCRSTTEVAGIGLDSKLLRFAKQHFSALWVTPLAGSAVLCLSAEAGVMLPWGPGWAARSTCISDRCAGAVRQ